MTKGKALGLVILLLLAWFVWPGGERLRGWLPASHAQVEELRDFVLQLQGAASGNAAALEDILDRRPATPEELAQALRDALNADGGRGVAALTREGEPVRYLGEQDVPGVGRSDVFQVGDRLVYCGEPGRERPADGTRCVRVAGFWVCGDGSPQILYPHPGGEPTATATATAVPTNGGNGGNGGVVYNPPVYEAPVYEAPSYEAPVYYPPEAPSYAAPVYNPPVYEAPVYPNIEFPDITFEAPIIEIGDLQFILVSLEGNLTWVPIEWICRMCSLHPAECPVGVQRFCQAIRLTPEPTDTPGPSPTPTPTPTIRFRPVPSATPTRGNNPQPTATPTPTQPGYPPPQPTATRTLAPPSETPVPPPTWTPRPTRTREPTAVPTEVVCYDRHLLPGEGWWTAPASATTPWFSKGDVRLSIPGREWRLWDDSPTEWGLVDPAGNPISNGDTGTLLIVYQQAGLRAPWGANLGCLSLRTDGVTGLRDELFTSGCESGGCKAVRIYVLDAAGVLTWTDNIRP